MGWLDKLFNKKKKMTPEQLQSLRDTLANVPVYQWIKTERMGEVCYFQDLIQDEDLLFVEFTDGSRINYNLLDEMVVKLSSTDDVIEIGSVPLDHPSANVGPTRIRTQVAEAKKDSPIHTLLKKQKQNTVCVDISLDLNMPPKDLYNVLESSFDNAQDEILEFIVADINIENIRLSVKEAIKKFYE